MNNDEKNKIRLEERARILMKVSADVGEMLKKCSVSDKEQAGKKDKQPNSNKQKPVGKKSATENKPQPSKNKHFTHPAKSHPGGNKQNATDNKAHPAKSHPGGNKQNATDSKPHPAKSHPGGTKQNATGSKPHPNSNNNQGSSKGNLSSNKKESSSKERKDNGRKDKIKIIQKPGKKQNNQRSSQSMTSLVDKPCLAKHYGQGAALGGSQLNNMSQYRSPDYPPTYSESISHSNQVPLQVVSPNYQIGLPVMQSGMPMQPIPFRGFCPPPAHNVMQPPPPLMSFQGYRPPRNFCPPMTPQNPRPIEQKFLLKEKPSIEKLHPRDIVMQLMTIAGFWTNVTTLSKLVQRDYVETLDIIKKNSGMFSLTPDTSSKGEFIVELFPKMKVCSDYLTTKGCLKQDCTLLHFCPSFISGKCSDTVCPLGHFIKTGHNNVVFKAFCLMEMSPDMLFKLLKKVFIGQKDLFPKICSLYQTNRCTFGANCSDLHICYKYVNTMEVCPNDGSEAQCSLNHNIMIQNCETVFKSYGVSLNESPRDLLMLLSSKSSLSSQGMNEENQDTRNQSQSTGARNKVKSDSDNLLNISSVNDRPSVQNKRTKVAWQLDGDVEIPFICLKRLENICDDLKGCKYLHAKSTFHWQFKRKIWCNFHAYHSRSLEKKFADVNCEKFFLSKLDPDRCMGTMKSLTCSSLLGNEKLFVNFNDMTVCSDSFEEHVQIRQITTPSSVAVENENSTDFVWYFKNDKNEWQDFISNENCSFSSKIMENSFLTYPQNALEFSNRGHTDVIDFTKKLIVNKDTGAYYSIRRRPRPSDDSEIFDTNLPDHGTGTKISHEKKHKIEALDTSSPEYKQIRERVCQTSPVCSIVAIHKIQNADLQRQFKNKELEIKKKQDDFLNVQMLFYGIADKNDLSNICEENVDFRVHGFNTNTRYGRGTYFYNSFAIASRHSASDDLGIKQVLVAHVIIGDIIQGDSSMTQPPENPATLSLYDTTVDNVHSTTTFVKYNKQEYYPAFVVHFK